MSSQLQTSGLCGVGHYGEGYKQTSLFRWENPASPQKMVQHQTVPKSLTDVQSHPTPEKKFLDPTVSFPNKGIAKHGVCHEFPPCHI